MHRTRTVWLCKRVRVRRTRPLCACGRAHAKALVRSQTLTSKFLMSPPAVPTCHRHCTRTHERAHAHVSHDVERSQRRRDELKSYHSVGVLDATVGTTAEVMGLSTARESQARDHVIDSRHRSDAFACARPHAFARSERGQSCAHAMACARTVRDRIASRAVAHDLTTPHPRRADGCRI